MKIFGKQDAGGTATMQEPPAAASSSSELLDQVQGQITELQQERAGLEGQSRGHSELIAAVDHESAALKQRMAQGDASVTPLLDTLDRKRTESGRKLDGLQSSIANVDLRMAPLQRRARELAQVADAERQDEAVARFEKEMERLSGGILSAWEKSCRDAHALVSLLEDTLASANLDSEHRGRVLSLNESLNNRFQAASLRPINENWIRRESHLFRRLAIQPARPK